MASPSRALALQIEKLKSSFPQMGCELVDVHSLEGTIHRHIACRLGTKFVVTYWLPDEVTCVSVIEVFKSGFTAKQESTQFSDWVHGILKGMTRDDDGNLLPAKESDEQ